jgi:serine/threonine protein kinase/tetratricopeptide (TPR) repeat protein
VFLSFSSKDVAVADGIGKVLDAAGVEVWLGSGDEEGAVSALEIIGRVETCALFLPIISVHTQRPSEDFFWQEWAAADQRLKQRAKRRPFVLPVLVDESTGPIPSAEATFCNLKGFRLKDGEPTKDFVSMVVELLAREGRDAEEASSTAEHLGDGAPVLPGAMASIFDDALSAEDPEQAGHQLGRYKLLEKIGEGGFGVVWMADQQEPIRRRVALKIIKLGMDTRDVISRFEAERQALALMEHPNIAHVYDAGATDTGRPFFVMELVHGTAITRYCDEQRIPIEGRLELFVAVCRAVQHAHQRGVIHRDLKPSNILVALLDGAPVPKIIDFGIAKATGAQLTANTLFTSSNVFIGTLDYTSPEQVETASTEVDPRSDVYSLGVVLYELLTGVLPFDSQALAQLGVDERRHLIREVEPSSPASRFRTLAENQRIEIAERRFTSWPALYSYLRGDPSWIAMKCLEKQRTRRYESAAALASDVGRMLERDLVVARPPSLTRRALRFCRRHGTPMTSIVAAATVALCGLFVRDCRGIERKTTSEGAKGVPTIENINDKKTIAVLPFENLSPDPANAFFADGIHEDVIVSLAKLHDLKVISRTSVMGYRTGARNLKAIATELGVTNILEGNVRRDGDRVRVSVQLVDAHLDQQIWAETYDRNLADTFAIQSDIAGEIALALRARLNVGEKKLIGLRPTSNLAAYDSYIRARTLMQNLAYWGTREEYERVVGLYEQAIANDASFTLAYAQLSLVHSALYRFSELDPRPARLERAKAAAGAASRLGPELPETKIATGVIKYLGSGDLEGALADFRGAEADLPNDAQLQMWIAVTLRRLSRWDEAIGYFESASELDPHVPASSLALIQTLRYMRRFAEARQIAEKSLARFPRDPEVMEYFAIVQFEVDGDREGFLRRMDALPPDRFDSSGLSERFESALRRRNWDESERVLADRRFPGIPELPHVVDRPPALSRAALEFFRGRNDDAIYWGEQALTFYAKATWSRRDRPWVLIGRARAEGFCGRTSDALKDAQEAWTLVFKAGAPDAIDMIAMRPLMAEVYIILDRKDDALNLLSEMMSGPSDEGCQELRWSPWWMRLKNDSRFERILGQANSI